MAFITLKDLTTRGFPVFKFTAFPDEYNFPSPNWPTKWKSISWVCSEDEEDIRRESIGINGLDNLFDFLDFFSVSTLKL
jgi:hypothetical protein